MEAFGKFVLLLVTFVLIAPLLFVEINVDAVRAGFAGRQSVWFGWGLDTHAALVSEAESSGLNLPGPCLIYIGQAGGFAALYDPVTDSSWRVSAGSIALRTRGELAAPGFTVPDDCPE